MTLWQTSLTYQIWVWLCDVYEDSTLHRFLAAAGRWCSGQIEESRILRPLCREGIVARSWKDSFLCRMLSALVNLPGTLLHAWYKAWNLTFEDSFFARLAFDMGDSASIAQFWCIAALWCIPYERWNNAYSFMTGVLLLLLFYAGAMRTGRRLDVARIGFYPALMLAAVTLAVTFSYAPGLSARFLIYHVSAALLVVITVSAVRNGEDLKRLCAGAAVCVGATGAYGIVQRIQGVKVNPSYVDLKVNAGMPGRVFSIFDNPNTFAQVLLLLLPLVLALFLTAKHWQWKTICAGIFCVGGMAMAMTYSRASWVGLAVAMAVFVFLWKPKLIPAFILLCVLAVPFLPTTVLNRIHTITNTAVVRLSKDDKLVEKIGSGDGPLDAAFNSIEKIVGKKLHLENFRILSNTEGKDALGDATVLIKDEESGRTSQGRGISTDVLEASLMAYVNAVNKMIYEERHTAEEK